MTKRNKERVYESYEEIFHWFDDVCQKRFPNEQWIISDHHTSPSALKTGSAIHSEII